VGPKSEDEEDTDEELEAREEFSAGGRGDSGLIAEEDTERVLLLLLPIFGADDADEEEEEEEEEDEPRDAPPDAATVRRVGLVPLAKIVRMASLFCEGLKY